MKKGYVYILTNFSRTVFYIGVTSNLRARLDTHWRTVKNTFVVRYRVYYLVYVEEHDSILEAITREKQLKSWHRDWKLRLIRSVNPDLRDMTDELLRID